MGNKILFEKLKVYRLKCNLTQQDVADYLNLKNKSVVGNWEIGKSEPSAEVFLRLCRLYRIKNVYELIGETTPDEISNDEMEIIDAYRLHPEMHNAVQVLLKVKDGESE